MSDIESTVIDGVGLITLQRPQALNALSLDMIRELFEHLLAWRTDPSVRAVAFRGMSKQGPFGVFCAGGDIRFFHSAAGRGDPALEDFFTEEYRLNHLIHRYPKPTLAFMDGIVMGGGMGLAQGCWLRIATAQTKMAMPETLIGLFPDVGGGYFLSRCPGHWGEFLALTGDVLNGDQAVHAGLADVVVESIELAQLWQELPKRLSEALQTNRADLRRNAKSWPEVCQNLEQSIWSTAQETVFAAPDLPSVFERLQQLADTPKNSEDQVHRSLWAKEQIARLQLRSPLMLHVTWEQIRRARNMKLADELRMERDLVRHCFHPQFASRGRLLSEAVEGIRALVIDKDRTPQWRHASIDQVPVNEVQSFFMSPWPIHSHPLIDLKD